MKLEHEPYLTGAHYETDGNRIVVTIYTGSKPLSARKIAEYTELVRVQCPVITS